MKLNILKKASIVAGRKGLKAQKYAPEICIGAGIASGVAAGIFACKATLKVDEVLEEAKTDINKLHEVKEAMESGKIDNEKYSQQDYSKDVVIVYSRMAGKLLRLYAPAIMLGALGIGSILYGYNIINKRNIAIMAAYKTVDEAYSEYRRRVIDELGEDADRRFRFGTKKEDIELIEETEDGKQKKKKIKNAEIVDTLGYSEYAKYFDAASPHWQKSPEYNVLFLKTQQQYANDLLNARGHVFLNEVYDLLGIPRTSAGSVVGWIKDGGDDSDNFIDFGMYDMTREKVRDFINGYENVIILDFNVDGIIWDKIDEVL